MNASSIGYWFMFKWRDRARQSSVFTAGSQMRKQGVPIQVALAVLGVRL